MDNIVKSQKKKVHNCELSRDLVFYSFRLNWQPPKSSIYLLFKNFKPKEVALTLSII